MEITFREADLPLKKEVSYLGRLLGHVIEEQEGPASLALEEEIRNLCKAVRAGDRASEPVLAERLAQLSPADSVRIARAFTLYFQLVNLAEQRHRTRRKREHDRHGKAQFGSIAHTLEVLDVQGIDALQIRDRLNDVSLELVLTAHPTQALRRTVLHRVDEIGRLLERIEARDLTLVEQAQLREDLLEQIEALWLTNQIRSERLSVLDEVRSTLYYFEDVFFQAIPRLHRELREQFRASDPDADLRDLPPFLTFASWVGGDGDGNPYVDATTVLRTLELHRLTARRFYQRQLSTLFFELGHNRDLFPQPQTEEEKQAYPEAAALWALIERYRRILGPPSPRLEPEPLRELVMRMSARIEYGSPHHYPHPSEMESDLRVLRDALARPSARGSKAARRGARRVTDLISALRTFGFHLASLDIRNNSDAHQSAICEFLGGAYADLGVEQKVAALRAQAARGAVTGPGGGPGSHPVLNVFRAIAEGQRDGSPQAIRNYVISMTRDASDIWEVLALGSLAGICKIDEHGLLQSSIHPVPLFETTADLEAAPAVLEEMFRDPAYRGYLERMGNVQQVMVGYSDSNKDGGYLTSHWLLYQGQRQMAKAAAKHGIRLEFFHGRGGTVARGGGRAYEAILALPPGTVGGRLRITEQGEVISTKYPDPEIAQRNLELAVSGTLLATIGIDPTHAPTDAGAPALPSASETEALIDENGNPPDTGATSLAQPCARTRPLRPGELPELEPEWERAMTELSSDALRAYQHMLHGTPDLLEYFWEATPISELGQLNIGSRPTFRGGRPQFESLRAIPWVFAWTQNRALLPAWYGLGAALQPRVATPAGQKLLSSMYRCWSFFRDLVDNAEMALAKADLRIAALYATLDSNPERAARVQQQLEAEYERSVNALLAITGEKHLLQRSPVLRRSIRLRNPYVDPLSYLQVKLLKSKRAGNHPWDNERALLLTIQGIAAGMRNTG